MIKLRNKKLKFNFYHPFLQQMDKDEQGGLE